MLTRRPLILGPLAVLGALGLAGKAPAEVINTSNNNQVHAFQQGATIEKFDDLDAVSLSSYAAGQTVPVADQFHTRDGATAPTFHSGGASPNDPIGNPGTPIGIVHPTGGISGDVKSSPNVAAPLVINDVIAWTNGVDKGFMEVIFPAGSEVSKVGFWVTQGSVTLHLRDRSGSDLTTGDVTVTGDAGSFIGIDRGTADIAVAAVLPNAVDAITIDDFTFSAGSGASTDPSGTYEGKITCQQVVAGVATKTKQDATIDVATGADGAVLLRITAGGAELIPTVNGHLSVDAGKAGHAALAGLTCGLDFSTLAGSTVAADVVVKGNGKASLKGSAISVDTDDDGVRTCTFSAKRTSTAKPAIDQCPV